MEAMLGHYAEIEARHFEFPNSNFYIKTSNITFSIVPGRHEHDRDRGGIPGHVAPGPAGHTRGGIREFLFRRKKKETTGTMKFLTISQLMGKSKNPLVMGVYPVVGDVFMMLGMALVCAKRARLCPEKFENTLSSIFLIADSNVASSSSSYPGVRVLLCARHRVRVRLRLSLLLRQGRGGERRFFRVQQVSQCQVLSFLLVGLHEPGVSH